ncbi:alpha/beta hydrolase [Streptomyces sp. NPDC052396]|uniref:alpha/beta hydrolase n=1 Tax=Streptomyces sp. NPDC052396 TaxID=3365689 RepID=UPI0037D1B153
MALRAFRVLLAVLVAASVAVPVSALAGAAGVPAPAPAVRDGRLPAANSAALAGRYAATRRDIEAAGRTAGRHGDARRAAALRRFADAERQFLFFDGRDGGTAAEVFGDLAAAGRIAVLVPGSGTSVDDYWRLRAGATALRRQLGGGRSAVIAWLGYRTPVVPSLAAITSARADAAAGRLHAFVGELTAARPAARISLLCHSYGSVVCARAVHGLRLADVVLYGSPGTGCRDAAALHTGATVWAGRGSHDWVRRIPHHSVRLPFTDLGFGTDPMSPAFGARRFPAGDGGHSDYLKPGSTALKNIARIVAGRAPLGGDHA